MTFGGTGGMCVLRTVAPQTPTSASSVGPVHRRRAEQQRETPVPPARTVIRGTSAGLATGLALSLLATAPAAAEPDDPSLVDDTAAIDALAPFHDQEIDWAPCEEAHLSGSEAECAWIEVPLDYSAPEGERIEIAILRMSASDPEARRGILLSNPGGPGLSGRDLGIELALDSRAGEVYDSIGMDPRGTGASTWIDCEGEPPPSYPRPTDEQISEVTRETIRYARDCDTNAGDLMPHMTTADTARDMDVIRAALGEERVSYVGYSYGTYLGAVYGSLFPERLDRSVLDSPVNPDGIWREDSLAQAPAYTANVERYAIWLAEHDEVFGMGGSPDTIIRTFEETADRLQEEPRPDLFFPGGFDGNDFMAVVGEFARDQSEWDGSAWFLKALVEDEPFPEEEPEGGFEEDTDPEPEIPEDELDLSGYNLDLHTAVMCEAEWPEDVSIYHSDMRDYRDNHPYGSGASWTGPQACTFSEKQPTEPLVDLVPAGSTGPLIIAAEYDANTAYAGGPAMAKTLDGSLLTITDEGGHGFYASLDPVDLAPLHPCVDDAVDAYLVDGTDPQDLECAGLPRPETTSDGPDTEELTDLFQRFEDYDGAEPTPARALGRH